MARTAAGHRSLRHELFLYRWAVDLLEFVVPLARDGVAPEEPTLLLLRADTALVGGRVRVLGTRRVPAETP
jgi:hypothetical protein